MPSKRSTILLFEDDAKIIETFKQHLTPLLKSDLELAVFPLGESSGDTVAPYEDRVRDSISSSAYFDRLVLIVTDRDLSTNSTNWRGLSQSPVSTAARRLGIPVACYRRNKPNVVDEFKRIPGDGLIDLSPDAQERAQQTAILARGFVELAKRVERAQNAGSASQRRKVEQIRAASPGALLAAVLEQPGAAAHLDTFACGDQVVISEILKFAEDEPARLPPAVGRRLVAALGVWLADLVMKYPGVLVNTQAAASYLDIAPDVFVRDDVQVLFAEARYTDLPFADDRKPLWWRHLLDDILNENGSSTGLELATKMGLKRLKYCPCSVNPKLHAGFLCMATDTPISAENSSGRVKWFPPGADLARLTKSTYKKLAPWIGT